ncbi:MAG: type III secretion chaperone [Chlamydiales bacterium]|nr:type III secretion chaperone [Chlamydiales bacterium]
MNWVEILGWQEEQLNEIRFSGFSFLREGKYEKARLFFEALLILDPKCIFDRQTLGAIYLQVGENEKALYQLEKALSMDPSHQPTLMNKAKALLMLGKKQEALDIIQILKKSDDAKLANDATALLMAHA